MPLSPLKLKTETDFEAELRAAIKYAFPWLPAGSVTHQKTFTFKFGHSSVTVDAEPKDKARARADVLVSHNSRPLAIFELKRHGLALTKEDDEQGLSYARVLHPRPPLVVISNGVKVRTLDTETGKEWKPTAGKSGEALKKLIERAATVAQSDLENAVATLMGSTADVWAQAVRQATSSELEERTGDLDEPLKPFARDFLLARKVTQDVQRLLGAGHRLLMLEGGPLSGKSNVLRELCEVEAKSADHVVLYIDADYDVDPFERIADILGGHLDWRISPEQTKEWLRTLSKQQQPSLILALDNVRPDRPDVRRAVESMTTNSFGQNLKIVVAVDDAVANQLVHSSSSRESSVFGRRATRVTVGLLNSKEFAAARQKLRQLDTTFAPGARHSVELRTPWLLRAIVARAVTLPKNSKEDSAISLSPVPGMEVLKHAAYRFDTTDHPFNLYREMAQALFNDLMDDERPYQLKLELMDTFIIRRNTALEHMHRHDLDAMSDKGLIREARSQSGDNIYVIRLPELMAYELAVHVAALLADEARRDAWDAAEALVRFSSRVPLGDVIAAFAILEMASKNNRQDHGVISALRSMEPTRGAMSSASQLATRIEGLGVVDIVIRDDGKASVRLPDGTEQVHENIAYGDVSAYHILAQLAGYALESDGQAPGSNIPAREDPELLLDVGSTPFLLRRGGSNIEINSIPVHDIGDDLTTVCHNAGIVEPITWSIVRFLSREDMTERNNLIDEAIDRGRLAMLARIDIALRYMANLADVGVADWANDARTTRVNPAINRLFPEFVHD
jgi:hypothetical protein